MYLCPTDTQEPTESELSPVVSLQIQWCGSIAVLVWVGGGEFLCFSIPSTHFVVVGERKRAAERKGRKTVWMKG